MIRLFHASDLHFGREDRAALDWFAGQVAAERPDAVIVTGDITCAGRRSEFAAAQTYLAALGAPVMLEPGNHDLPYFAPFTRLFAPYRRIDAVVGNLGRPVDLPGVAIVPLRTTARAQWRLNWSHGRVARGDLAAAVAQVRAAAATMETVLVACHHPLIDTGTSVEGRTSGGMDALEALSRAGADAVLSGHVHDPCITYRDTDSGSIMLIGAGTLSERLRESSPSFNEIRLAGGAIAARSHFMESGAEGPA